MEIEYVREVQQYWLQNTEKNFNDILKNALKYFGAFNYRRIYIHRYLWGGFFNQFTNIGVVLFVLWKNMHKSLMSS